MKKIIIVCILVLMSGCSNNSPSTEPDFIEIAKGILGGTEGIVESNLIIKNANNWTILMNKMDPHSLSNIKFIETDIDFNHYQVIAVFDKMYPNTGHSINITNKTENNSSVIIKVEKIDLGGLNPAHTQPYHIVKIKKTDKNIIFE